MKLNEKRWNKTKSYCFISEGRLNAESDFKSIFAVYREREIERVYSHKVLCCCCVDPCSSSADKVSAVCVLLKYPRLGIHSSFYFSVVSQDTEEDEISSDAKQETESVFLVRQQSGIIKFRMFRRFSEDFFLSLFKLSWSFISLQFHTPLWTVSFFIFFF